MTHLGTSTDPSPTSLVMTFMCMCCQVTAHAKIHKYTHSAGRSYALCAHCFERVDHMARYRASYHDAVLFLASLQRGEA